MGIEEKRIRKALYWISNIIFAIPPTQVEVERSFSALNNIFTESRYNLNKLLLENILLIHTNKEMFYEIKIQDIADINVEESE